MPFVRVAWVDPWSAASCAHRASESNNCCSVAASCDIPASCNIPNTCEVTSCDEQVTVPNHDFGSFTGDLHLVIDGGSATATATGKVCIAGTTVCEDIVASRVQVTDKAEICFSGLLDAVGDVCVAL